MVGSSASLAAIRSSAASVFCSDVSVDHARTRRSARSASSSMPSAWGEEVEDDRPRVDVLLEGRRAGQLFGTYDPADLEYRFGIGAGIEFDPGGKARAAGCEGILTEL